MLGGSYKGGMWHASVQWPFTDLALRSNVGQESVEWSYDTRKRVSMGDGEMACEKHIVGRDFQCFCARACNERASWIRHRAHSAIWTQRGTSRHEASGAAFGSAGFGVLKVSVCCKRPFMPFHSR